VISLAISSELLEIRPTLLYSDMKFLVSFPMIPKYVTLNDLKWLFCVKFSFRAHTGLEQLCVAYEINHSTVKGAFDCIYYDTINHLTRSMHLHYL